MNKGILTSVLINCESKPLVISIPMQQQKRKKYIFLRFGFLYQETLSSAASWVTMGSDVPSALTEIIPIVATG